MSVRSDARPAAVPPPPGPSALEPRLTILPPGERERRRARPDRRRADRRQRDLGAPYGAERRSGHDDRQADRRDQSKRAAGISLMRDYFSASDTVGPAVPSHLVVRNHD